ncbi:hypothetical protein D9V37_12925 [Nocardioides mangrovicus]|uniref:Uncharacterized protein n=1 Tax=Nocardioides mangrovicus TaxID=2478913 RepID=A0A3L8P1E4_9ACTN|nr:hypothetical protein D9V37_12925 [Nocardioides mangrovicus]
MDRGLPHRHLTGRPAARTAVLAQIVQRPDDLPSAPGQHGDGGRVETAGVLDGGGPGARRTGRRQRQVQVPGVGVVEPRLRPGIGLGDDPRVGGHQRSRVRGQGHVGGGQPAEHGVSGHQHLRRSQLGAHGDHE